ncbi:hypothetical protein Plhal304r1_c018g0065431 [Plasmopara halstedii]
MPLVSRGQYFGSRVMVPRSLHTKRMSEIWMRKKTPSKDGNRQSCSKIVWYTVAVRRPIRARASPSLKCNRQCISTSGIP